MGYYINPKDQSKEEWLFVNATRLDHPPSWDDRKPNTLHVCLIDNGPFTAAAVLYSAREEQVFTSPDIRPRVYFEVDLSKLQEVLDPDDYKFVSGG